MESITIKNDVCKAIVMTGVYYKNHHPGGISSVIQSWADNFEELQFYPMFKETNNVGKVLCFFNSMTRLFFKLLFDHRVKIVYIHTAADRDFWRSEKVIRLGRLFKKKVVLHSHASRFKDYYSECSAQKQEWIRRTIKKVDNLVVLSQSWKYWFEGIGIDSSKIKILHNITPYPQINSDKSIYNDDVIKLLFLGEIGPRKGVFDLLSAIVEHRNELKDKIELRIGGNKNEEQLMSFIEDGDLTGFVHFEGFVFADKKTELLNWANVYILPSHNEGLPISILEAMSYKMPIISTPVGGIPEVVDGSNGLLVTPGNRDEIYNAIHHYINNKQDVKIHGERSFVKVQPYLPNGVITELNCIFNQLLTNE